jgi:hypothetical protein
MCGERREQLGTNTNQLGTKLTLKGAGGSFKHNVINVRVRNIFNQNMGTILVIPMPLCYMTIDNRVLHVNR